MDNNIEEIESQNSLEDTMVFSTETIDNKPEDNLADTKVISTGEINVIKEKNEVVDFTNPIDVIEDEDVNKPSKKSHKKIKDKKNLFSRIKDWWIMLPKMKKIIYSVIAALILIFIVLLLLVLLKKDKDTKPVKTHDIVVQEENYIYKNGTLVFTDADKNEIGTYNCKNKDEKKCFVAYLSNEDDFTTDVYVDTEGNKIKVRSSIVNNDYVFIVDNKNANEEDIILYSIKSKSNVGDYKLVKQYKNNPNSVVLVDENDNYGVLDLSTETPKTQINFVYKYIGILNNDMATKYLVLMKNGNYYVADYTEATVGSQMSDYIVEFNEYYVVTKNKNNEYQIYDLKGHSLQDKKYLFIKLSNAYYAALADNGITVYDQTGLKYNESPIGLSSTNYNKTYVFDANNQVISSDVAFELSNDEDYVIINRGKTVDSLPIREAMLNKEHPYLSYYGGVLYFYTDETKTSLLGKYTCKNRNTPGQLDNCHIASSTKISNNDMTYDVPAGQIAILNNRYVFIKDSLSAGNIYLYDLEQSKKLGPYSEVEIFDGVVATESMKAINGVYVIAKNSKGLYGLLRINSSSVDFVLNFDYSELEKEGEYFLGKKSSGTYVLYSNSGQEVSKDVAGKVMSYNDNYIVAKTGNNYNIYRKDGSKIDNNNYAYIKLEATYYVAISPNNTVGIYEYNNPGTNVFKTPVAIKASDSWRNCGYFKVISTNPYVIKITDGVNDGEYTSQPKNDNTEPQNSQNNNESNEG